MKPNTTILVLFLFFVAFSLTLSLASSIHDEPDHNDDEYEYEQTELTELTEPGRLLSSSHYKTKRQPHRIIKPYSKNNKCRRFCRKRKTGPGGPVLRCCRKRCVDLLVNRNNCGGCGKKCKYNEVCCGGKCVNPLVNRSHCGGCHKGCAKGNSCAFGLCNYA